MAKAQASETTAPETPTYRDRFTNEELVKAVAKVQKAEGNVDDVVKELGLDPNKAGSKTKVSNKITALRKLGVHIPNFRRGGKREPELTPDQIEAFNKLFPEKTPEASNAAA